MPPEIVEEPFLAGIVQTAPQQQSDAPDTGGAESVFPRCLIKGVEPSVVNLIR